MRKPFNLIVTACSCGDFRYARDYTQQYGSYTTLQARLLSNAYYDFFRRDYPAAIETLNVHFSAFSVSELYYTLRSKTLLARVYLASEIYDGQDYEEALDQKDALRMFIKRKEVKLPPELYASYENFMRICNKISALYHKKNDPFLSPQQCQQLRRETITAIEETYPLRFRGWFRELTKQL